MKKIIALMLVLAIAISLVGCKSKGYTDDEEVAVIAGDETQVDIQENTGANKQEQKTEEKAETPKETVDASDKTTDESTENTDKVTDTSTESTDADDSTTQAEQITESITENNIDMRDDKDVNQVALDTQKMCQGTVYEHFTFENISDMIHTIKTHEYAISNEEIKLMEECHNQLSDKQLAAERISKIGTKEDVRFDSFNIDSIKYFYKIKDIPGYKINNISLNTENIQFSYVPLGKDKIIEDDIINVTYMRNEHFVTNSYLDDYMEYYKIKKKNDQILDKNDSVGGFLYEDDVLYTKRENRNYAFIRFAVENTMIEIIGQGDMANYDALKKLCVAEKVVVK